MGTKKATFDALGCAHISFLFLHVTKKLYFSYFFNPQNRQEQGKSDDCYYASQHLDILYVRMKKNYTKLFGTDTQFLQIGSQSSKLESWIGTGHKV